MCISEAFVMILTLTSVVGVSIVTIQYCDITFPLLMWQIYCLLVCWIFSYISHPETMCAWNTKDDIDSNWTLEPLARLHYRCCLEKMLYLKHHLKFKYVMLTNVKQSLYAVFYSILHWQKTSEFVDLEFVHYLYLVVLLDTLIKISICKPAYIKIMISLRLFSDRFQYVAK